MLLRSLSRFEPLAAIAARIGLDIEQVGKRALFEYMIYFNIALEFVEATIRSMLDRECQQAQTLRRSYPEFFQDGEMQLGWATSKLARHDYAGFTVGRYLNGTTANYGATRSAVISLAGRWRKRHPKEAISVSTSS